MNVDVNNNHVGYLLGRFFAVIEYAQRRGENESEPNCAQMIDIVSKLPQRVFPDLFRLYYQCMLKIGERNEGMAIRLESVFDEICVGLKNESGIPGELNAREQCFFFSGYRLQRMDLNKSC